MGTEGEIRASMSANEIELIRFSSGRLDTIRPPTSRYRYGGGDHGVMEAFVNLARGGGEGLTPFAGSVESHLMAFAAEESRVTGRVVSLSEYRRGLEAAGTQV